ncbi:MAG: F0F1 ATP synthase subunit B [Vicinamibacterales bacterium]
MNNPLVQLDPGLFIWTIATFLVLVALLAKFAWRPLLQALEERQASIRRSLDDAQQARQELERVQHESAQMIARARVEAAAIVSQSRSDAERLRQELRESARAEAAAILRNAERQIELQTLQAVRQIRGEAVELSVMIAEKLIGRHLTAEDNERLIQQTIDQFDTERSR